MIICPFSDLSRYIPVIPGLEEAMAAVSAITDFTPRTVPLSGGNRINIGSFTTKDAREGTIEAHRNYLDIQYVVSGEETMGWAPLAALTPDGAFNTGSDIGFYKGGVEFTRIPAGICYVVFPEDAHMPTVYLDKPHDVTKLVIKLKV
ncbi:MAG: YhcH/YjgK/YiaL family protein [Eubacteriales bacterium]|nr:YhcH/YjgK/YiaL family protein [Eubacteriales bacterium]